MQALKSKNTQTTLKHKASVPDYTYMVYMSIHKMWDAGSTGKPLKGITAGSRQIRTGNITKGVGSSLVRGEVVQKCARIR